MKWIGLLGASLAAIFCLFAFLKLGWAPSALFFTFVALAIQDQLRGRVTVLGFLPSILFPVYYWSLFVALWIPIFLMMLGIWGGLWTLKKKRILDPSKNYLGFGDVLALPYFLTLSMILIPLWGLVIFVGTWIIMLPWFMRKKERRFIPWLLIPLILIFAVAVIIF